MLNKHNRCEPYACHPWTPQAPCEVTAIVTLLSRMWMWDPERRKTTLVWHIECNEELRARQSEARAHSVTSRARCVLPRHPSRNWQSSYKVKGSIVLSCLVKVLNKANDDIPKLHMNVTNLWLGHGVHLCCLLFKPYLITSSSPPSLWHAQLTICWSPLTLRSLAQIHQRICLII